MSGDTDRTVCRFSRTRMVMGSKCQCRPKRQHQTKKRYPFRNRPHDGYPMEASFESIPKCQTNATTGCLPLLTHAYPGMYTQPAYVLCLLAASASGGDRQDASKSRARRRPVPTE
jgi:hypothetical protein